MSDDDEGVDLLRRSITEVVATLPAGSYPPASLPSPLLSRRNLAAAAVLAFVCYPAYLGLVTLPATRAELERARSEWIEAASAPIDLVVLTLPRRAGSVRSGNGSAAATSLPLAERETAVLLVEMAPEWVQRPPAEDAEFLFELRSGGESAISPVRRAVIRRWSVAERRVLELIEAQEGVPLLVRGRELPAGKYTLSLSRFQSSESEELSSLELEVTTPRPLEPE